MEPQKGDAIIIRPLSPNASYATSTSPRLKQPPKPDVPPFMTSFNDNDGVPSTGNSFILKDVLRDEWKYDGMVVTDWASTAEMISHGFCKDEKEAAMKSVNAGVDMEMVSGTFIRHLEALVKEKESIGKRRSMKRCAHPSP